MKWRNRECYHTTIKWKLHCIAGICKWGYSEFAILHFVNSEKIRMSTFSSWYDRVSVIHSIRPMGPMKCWFERYIFVITPDILICKLHFCYQQKLKRRQEVKTQRIFQAHFSLPLFFYAFTKNQQQQERLTKLRTDSIRRFFSSKGD